MGADGTRTVSASARACGSAKGKRSRCARRSATKARRLRHARARAEVTHLHSANHHPLGGRHPPTMLECNPASAGVTV